jgi:chemotaxis protein histidine kinase CheA
VKNAVEKLGGTIELQSEEKQGTKIKISLPFKN